MRRQINSNRDTFRWAGLLLGIGLILWGTYHPARFEVDGHSTSNVLILCGIATEFFILGGIQIIKNFFNKSK